jgi:MFS family permease
LYLHENREPRRHSIDYLGSAMLMLGIGAPMLALVQIGNADAVILAVLVAGGVAALAGLAIHERDAAEPMLSLKLWRNRVVAVGCLAGFFNGALMMGVSGFLPTYVQGAMGGDATASGVVLAASSVAWAFASMAAGRLMIRTSYRLAATIGGVCLVIGSLALIMLTPASGLTWAGGGAFLLGVGMGFCNTAFIVSVQASVGWNERGMATSSAMFMRIVGQSVGAAVFGAILNFGIYRKLPEAGDAVNRLMAPAARQTLGAAEITRLAEAVGASLHVVYIIAGLVAVISLTLALALPARLSPTRSRRGE